ncbi:AMP-binding protein [Streptosporangium lutulentum]
MIYTSGSTGMPKGVVVEHRNLASRVAWMRQAYGLHPGDRVVQFASLSFDTHAEEIYPALAAGARLRLLPDGGVTLPDHLDQVTVLDLPTAYWHALVDEIDRIAWPRTLRLVILGGEQVQETAVTRWRERFGDRIRLVNTYGPTEATIIATAAALDGSPASSRSAPRSATPGSWSWTATVNPCRRERRANCASAERVARGYLGRPELTGERFPSWGANGSTGPATGRAGGPTDGWSSSAARTARSRFAVTGSSSARWRHGFSPTPASARRRWPCTRRPWSATSSARPKARSCPGTWPAGCPPTWSPLTG